MYVILYYVIHIVISCHINLPEAPNKGQYNYTLKKELVQKESELKSRSKTGKLGLQVLALSIHLYASCVLPSLSWV